MSLLHIANGHCTTGLIEASGLSGRTMVWCDPLYEGPVPSNVSDEELVRIRARFLAAPAEDADDVAADLQGWRAAVDHHDQYDELVLWFEHDLFDQLNLIQLLSHLDRRAVSKPVSLICVDAYPGHPDFKGLGELQPADLVALFPNRKIVTAEQLALATRAWEAFRAPDPRAIETLLRDDTSALPFLAAALARHLEEFPSAGNGLSRSERRMMELAIDGPADIQRAFAAMHAGERAFFITDVMFAGRARDLSTSSPPLLTMHLTTDRPNVLPEGTIALTDAGRDVLNGGADRLQLCGIDRWLGGVHVAGRGPAWRWSATTGTIVLQ